MYTNGINQQTFRITDVTINSAATKPIDQFLGQAGKNWKKVPKTTRVAIASAVFSPNRIGVQATLQKALKAQNDLIAARKKGPGALSISKALANYKKAYQSVTTAERSAAIKLLKNPFLYGSNNPPVGTNMQLKALVAVYNKATNYGSKVNTITVDSSGDFVFTCSPPF